MVLKDEHWLRESYQEAVKETVKDIKRLSDVERVVEQFSQFDFIDQSTISWN